MKRKSILDLILKDVYAMARTVDADPFQKYNFEVIFTGLENLGEAFSITCGFSKVSGLKKEIATVKYAEGGWDSVRNLPARKKFEDLVLETGATGKNSFEQLLSSDILQDDTKRFTTIVKLKGKGSNADGNTPNVRKWTLTNCIVTKWEMDGFDATSDDVAMEKITIQYEDMEAEIETN